MACTAFPPVAELTASLVTLNESMKLSKLIIPFSSGDTNVFFIIRHGIDVRWVPSCMIWTHCEMVMRPSCFLVLSYSSMIWL